MSLYGRKHIAPQRPKHGHWEGSHQWFWTAAPLENQPPLDWTMDSSQLDRNNHLSITVSSSRLYQHGSPHGSPPLPKRGASPLGISAFLPRIRNGPSVTQEMISVAKAHLLLGQRKTSEKGRSYGVKQAGEGFREKRFDFFSFPESWSKEMDLTVDRQRGRWVDGSPKPYAIANTCNKWHWTNNKRQQERYNQHQR